MTDITLAPRRRPLWGLFIAPALLLIAAIVWSAFWFYAASQVDVRADAWRAQEAKTGRIYDCGSNSVSGFPFRLEVRCSDAGVKLVSQVKLFSHLANIGDTRSLIIHPASTTHRQLSDAQKVQAGAGPDVVRLSIGLEDPGDIIGDLEQALDAA